MLAGVTHSELAAALAMVPSPLRAIAPVLRSHGPLPSDTNLLDVKALLHDQVIVLESDLAVASSVGVGVGEGAEGVVEARRVLLDVRGKPVIGIGCEVEWSCAERNRHRKRARDYRQTEAGRPQTDIINQSSESSRAIGASQSEHEGGPRIRVRGTEKHEIVFGNRENAATKEQGKHCVSMDLHLLRTEPLTRCRGDHREEPS